MMKTFNKQLLIKSTVLAISLGVIGFGIKSNAESNIEKEVTDIANKAIVLEQVIPFSSRVQDLKDISAIKVEHIPEFDNVPFATPVLTVIAKMEHKPNLSYEQSYSKTYKDNWKNKANQLIDKLFVPDSPAYLRVQDMLNKNIQDVNGDIIAIDSGVSSVNWTSKEIDQEKGTAIFKGSADMWASYAQWQADKGYVPVSPHNEILIEIYLKQMGNEKKWMVTDLKEKFAPGSTP